MTSLLRIITEELLKNYGEVKPSEKVSGEIKEIDILFIPAQPQTSGLEILGLLGRFVEFPMLLEAFRNAASADEICDCLVKLLEAKARMRRKAKVNNTTLQEHNIPKLWVLTPTASTTILSSFNVNQKAGWLSGCSRSVCYCAVHSAVLGDLLLYNISYLTSVTSPKRVKRISMRRRVESS